MNHMDKPNILQIALFLFSHTQNLSAKLGKFKFV